MQFVCPFKSSLRPIPWHGHLAGSSSWLLLTIAEFWEDKFISAFSPLCPVLWSCVWYTCPTTSQEEHFLSIFCFLVTRCWFNLNENEPLFWYCSVVRKCLMYAACWMLTKELALYCCSLIIREWEPITGKWLSFNVVNSWRLFQVCFAGVEPSRQKLWCWDYWVWPALWSQKCVTVKEVGRGGRKKGSQAASMSKKAWWVKSGLRSAPQQDLGWAAGEVTGEYCCWDKAVEKNSCGLSSSAGWPWEQVLLICDTWLDLRWLVWCSEMVSMDLVPWAWLSHHHPSCLPL